MAELLLQLLAVLLAAAVALLVDRACQRRGLLPPAFASPLRRALATALLATVLWLGVFGSLATLGSAEPLDPESLSIPGLFLLHALMVATLAAWFLLGWGPSPAGGFGRTVARQLGLVTPRPLQELALGVLGGGAGWVGVGIVTLLVVAVYTALFGQENLPSEAPELVAWMAGLPVAVRVGLALSAGVVEEAFFRGFLQPRVGIGLSTALFVIAHAGYQQPLQLVILTFLSLLLAGLVRWRQNIWPAVVAHALFDMVQLLWWVPFALRFAPTADPAAPALLALLSIC
jgi:membrane protease YdiL (CAAX protease family)